MEELNRKKIKQYFVETKVLELVSFYFGMHTLAVGDE